MKTILFVEDRPRVYENFSKLLNTRVDMFKVLSATSMAEAIDIIDKLSIDVILMGKRFNGQEIDVLDNYLRQSTNTKLIVAAQKKSPLTDLLRTLEYKIQFDMPVDTSLLLDILMKEFKIDYGGQIRGVSLSSFLQMIELEGATCSIKVVSNKKVGYLYFDKGDLKHAEKEGLVGKEAALDIFTMEDSLISVDYGYLPKEKTIDHNLMSLLLEAGRIQDENPKPSREKRRYKRFTCSVSAEFDSKNRRHKGVIRDISLGGIFIENIQPLPVGQEIYLTLFSQSLQRASRIAGIIVRSNPEGMGVQFSELSMNQKRIIRLVIDEMAEQGQAA